MRCSMFWRDPICICRNIPILRPAQKTADLQTLAVFRTNAEIKPSLWSVGARVPFMPIVRAFIRPDCWRRNARCLPKFQRTDSKDFHL